MGEGDEHSKGGKRVWSETTIFAIGAVAIEIFCLVIYAIWFEFVEDTTDAEKEVVFYPYMRDVCIMVFVGFGFLMTFLRRAGFSAVGRSSSPPPSTPQTLAHLFTSEMRTRDFGHLYCCRTAAAVYSPQSLLRRWLFVSRHAGGVARKEAAISLANPFFLYKRLAN